MSNSKKIEPSKIQRISNFEEKYGIEDMNIYAYLEDDDLLRINGEIFGTKLKQSFKIMCSVYDLEGGIISSEENESYGGSGWVTSYINPACFKGIFPFTIKAKVPLGEKIGYIRVYPKK